MKTAEAQAQAPAPAADGAIIDPELAGEEAARRREIGRICAGLFIVGSVISLATSPIVEPEVPRLVYLLAVASLAAGIACLRTPWERFSTSVFHIVGAVGTLLVALWVWGVGDEGVAYQGYYVFIAVFIAYIFSRRTEIAAHLLLISVAILAPAAYNADAARETFLRGLVLIPSLVIAAAMVAYLRETLSRRREDYRRESRRDPLTGVGNYRTLREALDYEIVRHERQRRRFVVMMLDLDGFKAINDVHGHLEGDRLLREVAAVLTDTVRAQDTVARQGGDEFSVLAPETGAAEAGILAERIEQGLRAITVGEQSLHVTTGWAVYPDDGTDPETLIANADLVLREDKNERREAGRSVQAIIEKG